VVPDGALHELPFEALVLGSYESGATRTWLTDFGPTLYASSATALAELRARHARSHERCAPSVDVLTLSDPDFSRHAPADTSVVNVPRFRVEPIRAGIPAHLPPLPGTRAESAAVSAAFGGNAVVALQGEEATERAVRAWAPRARYLHLATHGLTSRTGSSALASLVLTAPRAEAAPEDDGLLQLFEIRELALCAELAVLSACETAVGERIEGEGVFALSRGFLTAGASRVIATLWPVSDRASVELVSELFRGVIQTHRGESDASVARALRMAKLGLAVSERHAAPFYWAPFVLLGVE
jgi:CHAT domain-containing protein